jgi:phage terminase large subunit GpA-like protein
MAGRILPPARRTRRAFAEATIIVPDGKYKNEYFNVDTQPFTRLLIAEMDSGRWSRFAVTGPTQTGKSFIGYVLPILYHLFELCENVILGLPDLNMASDKWRKDILPVIRASRYADQLPDSGRGSRSDEIKDSVTFKNGATLKVMSGGGGDAKRSGYTARVVAMTEVDKMDRAGEASRETSKIGQLEARTDAFADDAITYMECTVSYEEGRIWQEYIHGTASRIACPCPHCRVHVTPEREHLIGWVNAETEMDARENARWACPHCGAVITEDERIEMNRRGVLVHRGQEVTPEGEVVGPPPRTRTLGFRWNAFNNLFWTAATVASREWRAARNPDEEDAKKEMCQFVWVTPYKPPKIDLTQLDAAVIVKRITGEERGRVPADASYVTVGLDLGKRLCHWAAPAWREDGSPHVMDYGRFEVASDELGIERALLAALRDFRDQVTEKGWQGRDGDREAGGGVHRLRLGRGGERGPGRDRLRLLPREQRIVRGGSVHAGEGVGGGTIQAPDGEVRARARDRRQLLRRPDPGEAGAARARELRLLEGEGARAMPHAARQARCPHPVRDVEEG